MHSAAVTGHHACPAFHQLPSLGLPHSRLVQRGADVIQLARKHRLEKTHSQFNWQLNRLPYVISVKTTHNYYRVRLRSQGSTFIQSDNYWALISSQEAEGICEAISRGQPILSPLCTVNNSFVNTTVKLKSRCLKPCRRRKIRTLLRVTDCYFEMTDSRTLTSYAILVITNTTD